VEGNLRERILADCRDAVGEVRFGFASKRQVWAFEERHQIDVCALVVELAGADARAFLQLALDFHAEFAAVSNAWRVRDRIQELVAELCSRGTPEFLEGVSQALVDERLTVRHWLVGAFASAAPAPTVFNGLEQALALAYQPSDQWALLGRLSAVADGDHRMFGAEVCAVLASLAQLSAAPEQREQALELLAQHAGPAASAVLARAARGDTDPAVRARAAELLRSG